MEDLEKELGRVRWEEVKLGERRVYSLVYTDVIVLVAKDEIGDGKYAGK